MSPISRRTLARLLGTLLVAGTVTVVAPVPSVGAADEAPVIDAPTFREVGRITPADLHQGAIGSGGWLILSPASRRGYTLTEGFIDEQHGTAIESFDLDTLQRRQRIVVPGVPIPTGYGAEGSETAVYSGEVVHAVDSGAKRVYLPMSNRNAAPVSQVNTAPDAQRQLSHFLVIDESAFDRDPTSAFGAFSVAPGQERLRAYHVVGLAVSRAGVGANDPGRLQAVFASPYPLSRSPIVINTPLVGPYDHTLVQWDPAAVPVRSTPPTDLAVLDAPPVKGDWETVLIPCASAPMAATEGGGVSTFNSGSYQWGILATPEATFLGCQSAPQSGAVVRVGLNPVTGTPAGGNQQIVALAKPVGDVLVDEGGRRLFLRSFGDGQTWWAFDAAAMRFAGSIAGTPVDGMAVSAGVDPRSGRFYQMWRNICVPRAGGGEKLPVRGGLMITDARLDPVPAGRNVLPELAYPALHRIKVDPVTRRVFVRRGHIDKTQYIYPDCRDQFQQWEPLEFFYRVYEDRVPVAEQPGGLDDSALTTNVAEKAGVTEASFLGSGSGYGSRSLLTGGIDAVTNGGATTARSLCGPDDREALVGSVGKAEVSDQTIAAEAAALDADSRTQDVLGDPLSRCRPQAPPQEGGGHNAEELNRCHGVEGENAVDVREGAFDQAVPGVDENKDGCWDRDGENRYAARCLGTRNAASPGFDDQRVAPREGYVAAADCDEKHERAEASATGALSPTDLEQAAGVPERSVRVARSTSTVEVTRKLGRGVTVEVDSVARGVEISGVGTIGVVRAEAVSTATGRDRGASGRFTRTICDVDIQGFVVAGCLGDEAQQQSMVKAINDALNGRGTARLRRPDPSLAEGTPHGYLAGIQRDRGELFGDQVVTKDRSLAVPALEIIFYQGDGGEWGAGRQVFHLAGVQATTSYGIACTYGKRVDGKCAAAGEESTADFGDLPGDGGGGVTTITERLPGESALALTGSGKEGIVTRILRAIPRAVAEALRLLFNNPRELGLLAALWALLYAPCYLGDRRRAVRLVAARRLSSA